MSIDYAIAQRAQASEKEKERLKPLVRRIYDYAVTARREGLLAVEDYLSEEESEFLRQSLQLVVDGTDPAIIDEVLNTRIAMSAEKGAALLAKLIMQTGTMAIQQGHHPKTLLQLITAFFGETDLGITMELESAERNRLVAEFLDTEPGPIKSPLLDPIIPKLDDRSIQKLLREVDTTELAFSMLGAATATRPAVLRNMSGRGAYMLVEDINYLGPVRPEDVEESQRKQINILNKLVEQGEVPPFGEKND